MAENIKFGIEFDVKTGQAQLKTIVDGFDKVGNSAKLAGVNTKKSFGDSIAGLERFSNLMSNLKGAFTQVFSMFSEAISYSNQYETALTGLAKTAENFAQSQTDAKKAAIELSKDGLVNVTANATSLKFLLQSGFDLKQAMNLTSAAKDMGAFGRTTQDFNQAMMDFARGVKTGSLELTENIGFTQRFSAIMKTANVDISNGIDLRNNLAQREAFYNAVLKEGELNKGNAQKYLETTAGAMQSMSTQINILKKDMGDFVKIIIAEILPNLKSLVSWLKDNLAVVIATVAAVILTVLVPALYTFGSALAGVAVSMGLATGGLSVLAGAIAVFMAYKFSDEMIKTAKATKDAADATQLYADNLSKLNQAEILKEITQKTKEIAIEEKRNNELYAIRTAQLKEIGNLEGFALIKKQEESARTKFLIDQNNVVLSQNKEKLKLALDQRDENIKARGAAKDESELTKEQIKALNKLMELRRKNRQEEAEEAEKEGEEIQRKLDQHVESFKKANEEKLKSQIKLSEDSMDAEMEAYISGKTNEQVLEEELQAKQLEIKKKSNEEWISNNQFVVDSIKVGYESLSAGLSAFIQVGISGGNALKAAWQSFTSSILSMLSQMIVKLLLVKALTALGGFIGGGVGNFITSLAGGGGAAPAGEKGGLPGQFERKKLERGGVLWQGASHANGGIPVEVEHNEITLTKGVYQNPVLRGIASMINVAAGGVSIPNAPRAAQLANGGLPALSSGSANNSDSGIVMNLVSQLANTVDGLVNQIDRFKATDDKTIFMKSSAGQLQVAAVV